MTTVRPSTQTCCVCGTSIECMVLASISAFGSPDLDLRPPEMARYTLGDQLQECPECGYVNGDLGRPTEGAAEAIRAESYVELRRRSDIPEAASRFARYALLRQSDRRAAGRALLSAAWVCDDAFDTRHAQAFRSRAADALLELRPFVKPPDEPRLGAVLVDVLRRAQRFDEALALAEEILASDAERDNPNLGSVLRFQRRLCADRDTDCYTVADAVAG